ncbi:MAG TPA: Fic family protein, partial [Acidimicrobiales bacterium]|nr:Fic family protein [Acidimicrobiales bacterium]
MDSPIIFSSEMPRSTISRRQSDGTLLRIARGIYSTDVHTSPEDQVNRHWMTVVAHEVPGAVIVDRSAPVGRPRDGHLFVDAGPGPKRRPIELPGLTIIRRSGPGPLDGDMPLRDGLMLSSQARALADNSRRSRAAGGRPPATLTDDEIADWIADLATRARPAAIGRLRDEAERLAEQTGTTATIGRVSELLGAALGTRTVDTGSRALGARQAGRPYDQQRVDKFAVLVDHLSGQAPSPVEAAAPARAVHLPFFEAYFSNFIEGTVLTLDEAEGVMYRDEDLPTHPEDAHDVAATFRLAADPDEARQVPASADELIAILRHRHATLMAARTDKHPGQFKGARNQVGRYVFVHHDQVEGTLQAGWDCLDQLDDPFQRAVAMMYVVTEVHPFDDGNGRVARLMMNAELTAAGESRLIIPPVYRGEYLASLSTMSTTTDRTDSTACSASLNGGPRSSTSRRSEQPCATSKQPMPSSTRSPPTRRGSSCGSSPRYRPTNSNEPPNPKLHLVDGTGATAWAGSRSRTGGRYLRASSGGGRSAGPPPLPGLSGSGRGAAGTAGRTRAGEGPKAVPAVTGLW